MNQTKNPTKEFLTKGTIVTAALFVALSFAVALPVINFINPTNNTYQNTRYVFVNFSINDTVLYGNISIFAFNATGGLVNYSSQTSRYMCYQEQANSSTGGIDGFCGQNYSSGIYDFSNNFNNKNLTDYNDTLGIFNFTYIKPANAKNTSVITNYYYGCFGNDIPDYNSENVSISQECWDYSSNISFRYNIYERFDSSCYGGGHNVSVRLLQCFNGTEWKNLSNYQETCCASSRCIYTCSAAEIGKRISEEAMNWNITDSNYSSFSRNFSMPYDGVFYFNATIYNNTNGLNISETRQVTINTVAPILTISEPKAQNYPTTSFELNYSVSGVNLAQCWYNVKNSSNGFPIGNTTIASCANTTFNLPANTENYTLTLYANDSALNLGSSSVSFGVVLSAPSVVLNYPANNQWFKSGSNIQLNFTATYSAGLETCELWGNFTNNVWAKNYTWFLPTNATENYTTLNLKDKYYTWNVRCNKTSDWGTGLSNFFFGVDTVKPNVTANSVNIVNSQTIFTFNATSVDDNLASCKYSISTDPLAPGTTNFTYSCNALGTANAGGFGQFYLFLWATDLAGNEGNASIPFLTYSTGPGGGGGSNAPPIIQNVSLIGICGTGICDGNKTYLTCPQDCTGNLKPISDCFSGGKECIFGSSKALLWIFIGVIAIFVFSLIFEIKNNSSNTFSFSPITRKR